MRMGLVKDFGRRAVEDKRLQRLVIVAALLAARKELPVGEGPRAALAEGVVRIGINIAVAVDLRDIDLAGRDVAAPFQNYGRRPSSISRKAAKSPAGPDPTITTSVLPATDG